MKQAVTLLEAVGCPDHLEKHLMSSLRGGRRARRARGCIEPRPLTLPQALLKGSTLGRVD